MLDVYPQEPFTLLTVKVTPLEAAPTFEYPVPAPFLTFIPLLEDTQYVPVEYLKKQQYHPLLLG